MYHLLKKKYIKFNLIFIEVKMRSYEKVTFLYMQLLIFSNYKIYMGLIHRLKQESSQGKLYEAIYKLFENIALILFLWHFFS